jgi:hypothetical protein
MEDERPIIRRVIKREMNGEGPVNDEPVISENPKKLTYCEAGHVSVTSEQIIVDKPFRHGVYRVTVDTPYLRVVATADKYGRCKVNLKVLDGKGNVKQNKLFQGKQFVPIRFQV